MNLCRPELSLDGEALNARLTRLEEQIKSGVAVAIPVEERPLPPVEELAPPQEMDVPTVPEAVDEAPVGFWTEVVTQMRQELKPPALGYFGIGPKAPIQGVLQGDRLILQCDNDFVMEYADKPEILALAERKAAALLGRKIKAVAQNKTKAASGDMEHFLNFGKAHPDFVNIKK